MSESASGASPRRPTLELERDGERIVLELLARTTVLGASPDADLSLALPGLAPLHVRFEREGERLFAVALDALHPLRVQGVERREWLLRDGDAVELGSLRLVFRWAEAQAQRAVASSLPAAPPARPSAAPARVAPAGLPAVSLAREGASGEPRERRAPASAGWPWPAKLFLVLIAGMALFVAFRNRGTPAKDALPPASKSYPGTDGLEPFFYFSIYPISERLDEYPAAARLIAQRCQDLLASCEDPRTRVLAERALAKARARVTGSTWTFDEMRYATENAPTGGRDEAYFRSEKRAIVQAFLATNPGGADRFVAEAKLKQLDS
ncbi:MAG: hypothetical protein IPN34_09505 [Planctomycetes bacterium]|nr:hypothetical protein [Planctomycetota bacterium]